VRNRTYALLACKDNLRKPTIQIDMYPSCTVIEFWQGSMLTYSFSRKYAEQADIIDQKLEVMMKSFRTR
jgi:hypothetical protein